MTLNDNDISLKNCKYLLCADDLKLFKVVNSTEDVTCLQENLITLFNWCEINQMINIRKCHTLRFYRKKAPIISDYGINDIVLESI